MKLKYFLYLFLPSAICLCQEARATSVTLNAAPNPSIFGRVVTLTATVSPSTATGKVTFYDGPQILGVGTLKSGVATIVTEQIPAGGQSLTARYDGDANNPTAATTPFLTTVTAEPGSGFGTGQSYTTGTNPSWVVTADFNGDGLLDTAVISGASQAVFVLLGKGDGTFQAPVSFPAGAAPTSIGVGDFNGDGKQDLVVSNAYDGNAQPGVPASVDVLIGNGDGSFQAPIIYTSDEEPFAVAVGDFNNDGIADVAVANESYSDVSVYLGNGDGTLRTPNLYTTDTTLLDGAVGLGVGDFNRDGFLDIAVAQTNESGTSAANVVILLGKGDGTFNIGGAFPSGNSPSDVEVADLNADGKLDLVIADYGTGQVGILLGIGDGTFQPLVQYAAQIATSSVIISDFNGDGKLDIAAANNFNGSAGSVSILAGNGNGTFQAAQNFSAGVGPDRMAIADFNGDGVADLAVADLGLYGSNPGNLLILLGGCATATTTSPLAYDANGGSVVFAITVKGNSCSWTASSPVSWITVSPASGTGNGTVTATIAPFSPPPVNPADRGAAVTIAGINFNILQDFTVQQFTDVLPSSYQFDAVNLLKTYNITTGCTATTFCATANIPRDQMAVFIVRAVYGSNPFTIQPIQYFADVPPSAFGYTYIEKMYELGITTGCGGGNYCPSAQVTRDQMAAFIIRARYGAGTNFTFNPNPFFIDVPGTDPDFKWVQRMKEDNITSGCSATQYCPTNPVVRGDMAIFVMRGAFNQLLPATEPVITSVSPMTLASGGTATFTVTGLNTTFGAGTTVVNVGGGGVGGVNQPASSVTASNVVVDSPTQLTVTLTSNPAAPAQPEALYVQTGAQEAVGPNMVIVQ